MKKLFKTAIAAFFTLALVFTGCTTNANITKASYSYTPVDDSDLENMTAQQFTKIMGNGINLGNTFESSAASWASCNASSSTYETGWGQPVTNIKMMQAYKAAGFDSIRIPIAWTSTMDWVNGDYTINDDFMNRIKTVVGYALDSGLIVMINDHWDYQWWGLFGNSETEETAYKIFDAIWDQVGTAFKDYDCRLIFEAGNEEWGDRFNDSVYDHAGSKLISSGGSLSEDEQYKLITTLAQRFVDKIRSQGSKNEKRFLLIPGYGTGFDTTCDSRYKMPTDDTNSVSKLIVSVHYYSPALYCIAEEPVDWGGIKQPATTWGTSAEVTEQNNIFASMKKFINAGYGVIIGEYAPAMLKVEMKDADGNTVYDSDGKIKYYKVRKDNDTIWMKNVLDNCDKYNYCPFLWDCNGYFYKGSGTAPDEVTKITTYGFADSDVAAVYKNRNYASESGSSGSTGNGDTGSTDATAKTATVAADGIIEYTTNDSCTAGQEITVTATVKGASNFKQIGFQSSADNLAWHATDWHDSGFSDNYTLTFTFTSTEAVSNLYFKFIFQSLVDSSKTSSEVTVSNVSVTVN